MDKASTAKLDAAAIGLSLGCAAHCLVLPAAAASLPMLGVVADAEWVHWAMLALAAPIAVLALRRPQTFWSVRVLAASGLGLMVLGVFGWPAERFEAIMTVGGGSLLAIAHLTNALTAHRRIPVATGSARSRPMGQ